MFDPQNSEILLQNLSSNDTNLRLMGISNLINNLQTESFQLDTNFQHEIVHNILKLLEDTNSEIKMKAVQSISPLLYKLNGQSLNIISSVFCKNFLNAAYDETDLRNTIIMSLKIMFDEFLQRNQVDHICNPSNVIMNHLITSILDYTKSKIRRTRFKLDQCGGGVLDILDIIIDVLSKENAQYKFYLIHIPLSTLVKKNLMSPREAIKRRIISLYNQIPCIKYKECECF
ncbi:unnamed protein product, partial [Rotaria sp. Silwood1]